MRILGADLAPTEPEKGSPLGTLAALGPSGEVAETYVPSGVADLVTEIGRLAGGEPFLLGVNLPVVVPAKPVRSRPVENLVRRRLGCRMPPGGRTALQSNPEALSGESLLASLAGAGHACLTYPERNMRSSGLAEIHPAVVLKTLMWTGSILAGPNPDPAREELFKAYSPPDYRARARKGRSRWQERSSAADLCMRTLEGTEGFDFRPAREALSVALSEEDVERAVSLLDACLIAGAARRYLESPEECAFIGERESGYTITPADGFIRRLTLRTSGPSRGRLFPQESLRQRLSAVAKIRSLELLAVRGKPQRIEATFPEPPLYEFDNLDEMLWWKHCRHLAGPALPTEGLNELVVQLGTVEAADGKPLHLVRSRHTTLSFRFDPPDKWRSHIATRDGKVYAFRVLRATYETLPA